MKLEMSVNVSKIIHILHVNAQNSIDRTARELLVSTNPIFQYSQTHKQNSNGTRIRPLPRNYPVKLINLREDHPTKNVHTTLTHVKRIDVTRMRKQTRRKNANTPTWEFRMSGLTMHIDLPLI